MKSNLKVTKIVLTVVVTVVLAACGGGGGGDGSGSSTGISYTGLNTQATINETNAEGLSRGAYEGGLTGASIASVGALQVAESESEGRCLSPLNVAQILEASLGQVDFISTGGGFFNAAVITETDTIAGTCGGSASYTIKLDDQTGDFSGSFNFNSYCDIDITLSGSTFFSGHINLNTSALEQFSFSFDNLTGTSGGDSVTLDGDITFDVAVSPATLTIDMLLRDNTTEKVYWVNDYTIRLAEEVNLVSVEIFGTYYDPDYGYITFTTDTPLLIYNGYNYPSDGVLVFTGNLGDAGGSTKARLTALSSTSYLVEADTNGDNIYNYSEIFTW